MTPTTHAQQSLHRYYRLKREGRCPCGRRARVGKVKCQRCGAADSVRARKRYAWLVRMAGMQVNHC